MKKIKGLIILLFMCFLIMPIEVKAKEITEVCLETYSNANSIIAPRSDIIEWRYKKINGKLYKRKYNVSKKKWVGAWTPC